MTDSQPAATSRTDRPENGDIDLNRRNRLSAMSPKKQRCQFVVAAFNFSQQNVAVLHRRYASRCV